MKIIRIYIEVDNRKYSLTDEMFYVNISASKAFLIDRNTNNIKKA